MIKDRQDFEAALERAAAFLAEPPAAGTPEETQFWSLLEELARYRPQLEAEGGDRPPLSDDLAVFDSQLAAFRERFHPDQPPAFAPGFGLGQDLKPD